MAIKIAPSAAAEPKPAHKQQDYSAPKKPITIRLRPETIAKFKATGKGWQSRISAILDERAEDLQVKGY